MQELNYNRSSYFEPVFQQTRLCLETQRQRWMNNFIVATWDRNSILLHESMTICKPYMLLFIIAVILHRFQWHVRMLKMASIHSILVSFHFISFRCYISLDTCFDSRYCLFLCQTTNAGLVYICITVNYEYNRKNIRNSENGESNRGECTNTTWMSVWFGIFVGWWVQVFSLYIYYVQCARFYFSTCFKFTLRLSVSSFSDQI